jgi:hypothetical protein
MGRQGLSRRPRRAISLALARLPLEAKYAKHLARINELPPDPPQNLLTFTAAYLAGIANGSQAAGDTTDAVVPAPTALARHEA